MQHNIFQFNLGFLYTLKLIFMSKDLMNDKLKVTIFILYTHRVINARFYYFFLKLLRNFPVHEGILNSKSEAVIRLLRYW